MKKTQTKLLDYVINPAFLEQIKQPIETITFSYHFSFTIKRNGKEFNVVMFPDKEGSVSIKYGTMNDIVIQDYCQNIEDFLSLLEKLDDLQKRMPTLP